MTPTVTSWGQRKHSSSPTSSTIRTATRPRASLARTGATPLNCSRDSSGAPDGFFDEELGPHVRRALFYELLPETDFAAGAFTVGCGRGTRRLYRALFPALRVVMNADLKIDAAGAARSREKVLAALERLEG